MNFILNRSSGGQSDASDGKNDSDTSERRKKRSSSSSSTSSSHRHHRHHHKSRSSKESDGDNVTWTETDEPKRPNRHRAQYDDNEDDANIYDMPKMPPVPVALPPPQRYANEEKDDKSSSSSNNSAQIEQLYNKVSKSKHVSKGLQAKVISHQEEEEDNIEDLYAQDSLIQAENIAVEGIREEGGFYENVGYEIEEKTNKKEIIQPVTVLESNKSSAGFGLASDSFDQKFITVGEALAFSESGKNSPTSTLSTAVDKSAEALYDVPRSNRRVSSSKTASLPKQLEKQQQQKQQQELSEAIYVNDSFVAAANESTYDVPRNEDFILLDDALSESYDVARTRDSLSTIEEEHQVYLKDQNYHYFSLGVD
jgi:hypothetical protein